MFWQKAGNDGVNQKGEDALKTDFFINFDEGKPSEGFG